MGGGLGDGGHLPSWPTRVHRPEDEAVISRSISTEEDHLSVATTHLSNGRAKRAVGGLGWHVSFTIGLQRGRQGFEPSDDNAANCLKRPYPWFVPA